MGSRNEFAVSVENFAIRDQIGRAGELEDESGADWFCLFV